MKFVCSAKWIGRGVCKENPDKIALTEEELAETFNGKTDGDDEDDDVDETEDSNADSDEYDIKNYDNDEGESTAGLSSISCFASNKDDPYLTLKDEEDPDGPEDDADIVIQSDDNVIVVADVENHNSSLQFYVYNAKDRDFFVHHDVMLSMMPLCVEWIGYDASSPDEGNFVAVGGMSSEIEVWDVDIIDCIEPAFTLGSPMKKKKKSIEKKTKMGHTGDILDLAWNASVKTILASGSADATVILWDISSGKAVTKHSQFNDKVQSLQWHPFEANVLLTGCCDNSVRLFDCRTPDTIVKEWTLEGEVEKVIWNHFNPFYCLASSESGSVYCYDARSDSSVWTLNAHPSSAVTGLSLSSGCPGLMVTASVDTTLKVWDILNNKPAFVCDKAVNVGKIYTTSLCVDSPFLVCCGGDNKNHRFKVLDLNELSAVTKHFRSRQLMTLNNSTDPAPRSSEASESEEVDEMEPEAATMSTIKEKKLSNKKSKQTTKKIKKTKSSK